MWLHARPGDLDATGINCRLHVDAGGELGDGVAAILDGDGVGAREGGAVGDVVGAVRVVVDQHLSFDASVRQDLNGQLSLARLRAVHGEGGRLSSLATLQAWPAGPHLAWVEHGLDGGLEG